MKEEMYLLVLIMASKDGKMEAALLTCNDLCIVSGMSM